MGHQKWKDHAKEKKRMMKKGQTDRDMLNVFILIAFAVFLIVAGVPYIHQLLQPGISFGGTGNIVSYQAWKGDVGDYGATFKCGYIKENGILIHGVPRNIVLNREKSYITIAGHGTYPGSSIDYSELGVTTCPGGPQCYGNAAGVTWNDFISMGDTPCQVTFHLDYTNNILVTTTTTLQKPPPPVLSGADIFINILEKLGAWFRQLLGFTVYTGQPFVTLSPGSQYNKIFTFDTSGIQKSSCYDPVIYASGDCNYLHKCYTIAPKGCESQSCFAKYDCIDITSSVGQSETLQVTWNLPLQLQKEYGVVASVVKTDMHYDISSSKWTWQSNIVESTKKQDIITVPGAPAPPSVNPIEILANIVNGIIDFFKGIFIRGILI